MVLEETSLQPWLKELQQQITPATFSRVDYDLKSNAAIMMDPEMISRCVSNILDNARDAMQENGDPIDQIIEIRSRIVNENWELSIKDKGSGIPEGDLPKIFEPLFSTKGFGVGLGLTMVKQIIDGHKGTVEVQSDSERGTTVILRLPILRRLDQD